MSASDQLPDELRHAAQADTDPWDVTLYTRAADEIERLWQKEQDILAGIQLVVKGSNAARDKEIKRLRSLIEHANENGVDTSSGPADTPDLDHRQPVGPGGSLPGDQADIVTRLRDLLEGPVPMTVNRQDLRDAVAEIERLAAENERLEAKVRSQAFELMIAHSELLGLYDLPGDQADV